MAITLGTAGRGRSGRRRMQSDLRPLVPSSCHRCPIRAQSFDILQPAVTSLIPWAASSEQAAGDQPSDSSDLRGVVDRADRHRQTCQPCIRRTWSPVSGVERTLAPVDRISAAYAKASSSNRAVRHVLRLDLVWRRRLLSSSCQARGPSRPCGTATFERESADRDLLGVQPHRGATRAAWHGTH